jgi:hypothetical protein
MALFPVGDNNPIDVYPITPSLDGSELVSIENKGTGNLYVSLSDIRGFSNSSIEYRSDIPSFSIQDSYFQTRDGAQWIHGTSAGPMAIQDYSGQWWEIDLSNGANVMWFGALNSGVSSPLSGRYATLAAAQAIYPFVTALTQEMLSGRVTKRYSALLEPDT